MKSKYLYCLLLIVFLCSCNRDLEIFGNDRYVSIDLEYNNEGFSEYSYTFQYLPVSVTETEVNIPIALAGRSYSNEKVFSIKVVDSLTTAKEGLHYQLNPQKNIIKANKFEGNLYVKLLKTSDMSETSYTLALEIVENEFFKCGANKLVIITFSNTFEKPEWWYTNSKANIGYYTKRKLALWFEFWGITDGSDPWEDYKEEKWGMIIWDADRATADKEMFKIWLNAKPIEEVTDEYGDLVVLTLYRLER